MQNREGGTWSSRGSELPRRTLRSALEWTTVDLNDGGVKRGFLEERRYLLGAQLQRQVWRKEGVGPGFTRNLMAAGQHTTADGPKLDFEEAARVAGARDTRTVVMSLCDAKDEGGESRALDSDSSTDANWWSDQGVRPEGIWPGSERVFD